MKNEKRVRLKPLRESGCNDPAGVVHFGRDSWSQIEKSALHDFDRLICTDAVAARVVVALIRLTERGSGGVVVISRASLCNMLNVSNATLGRAITRLINERWVQRVRIGSVAAFAVSSAVAWTGSRTEREFAVFSATVVAARSEQDAETLESHELRQLPALQSIAKFDDD